MSSGIDCGKLEEVLESIFQIPVDAAKLDKWVNGGEFETVILGGKEVPTLRNLVRQIDERSSQAAEEEINEAKKEIGALAEKLKAKIEELKALTASAETLPPDHPATAYYNSGTGEIEFGIPQGKQGIQGERGLAPAIDIIYGGDPSDEALSIIYAGNPALDEPGDRTIIRQVARIGTSAQWATANPILEDGESGYERTPEDKLLWKTGDGVTHWNDLPYPSILVDKIYRYRGSVATVEDLPTDAAEGDVYNITSTGANYAWTGTEWDNLGVAGAIDPVPVKDSGNPVASGGVYAALEDMQTDIAATGAPDDVTIIKDESGKLVAQDIAIGGDPTDLASARGYIVDELLPWYPGYFDTPLADFDAATILGRYHVAVHKETTLNAPPILLFTTGTTSNDGMLMVEAMSSATGISSVVRYRQTFMVFGAASKIWVRHQGTSGEWQAWREIIADTNIGDGIRVTGGILSVPEYEGATATEPGTAGLVNPAASAEKDYVYHGDGTWRENTNVKVDGTTIAKDGSDVISVIPGGIIDNDTIVLDASGKISTKSVPFDDGDIFDIYLKPGVSSLPSVSTPSSDGSSTSIVPDLSSSDMVGTFYEGKSFGHVNGTKFVFDTDGFYIVSIRWIIQPLPEHQDADNILELMQEKSDGSRAEMATTDFELDLSHNLGAHATLTYPIWGKTGESVYSLLYVPSNSGTNKTSTVSWNMRIMRLPVTNEYQASNSELNIYYNGESAEVPVANVGNAIFSPWDLVERTDSFTRKFSSKNSLGYVQINESGLYYISHILTISPFDTAVDLVCGVSSVTENGDYKLPYTKSTLHLDPMSIATDVNSTSTVRYVEAGEIFAFYIQDGGTVTGNYTITNSSMSFAKFPSLVDASNILPFTPPTADAPGKGGLVPQPQATDPSVQPNNVLTMQGWKKISSAAMIPDEESGELIQAMGVVYDPVDLNDIFSGNYYLDNIIANAPNNEKTGNLLVWKTEVGTSLQVFIKPSGIFVRGSSTTTGQFVWGSWDVFGAPKPQAAEGVGQWTRYGAMGGTIFQLPEEGVWAYSVTKRNLTTNGVLDIYGGVAAGGTIIDSQSSATIDYVGLAWQVSA